jgi:hypothetical protein
MNTRTTKGYGTFGRILGQRKGSKPNPAQAPNKVKGALRHASMIWLSSTVEKKM